MNNLQKNNNIAWFALISLLIFSGEVNAISTTIGGMASSITKSFGQLAKLITAGSYVVLS